MKVFRLAVLSAALVAVVCVASSAYAQQRGGFRGGFGGGGLTQILGFEGVDEELELTEDQQKDVQSLIAETRKEIQESIGEFNFRNALGRSARRDAEENGSSHSQDSQKRKGRT